LAPEYVKVNVLDGPLPEEREADFRYFGEPASVSIHPIRLQRQIRDGLEAPQTQSPSARSGFLESFGWNYLDPLSFL